MVDTLHSLEGLFALAAAIFLVYGPWQRACEDRARDMIFDRRETLFDLAASGAIDFNSLEYRTIRASFEDCIRFAHKINWWLVVMSIRSKHVAALPNKVAQAAGRIGNPEVRAQVQRLIFEVQREVFLLLVLRAPLLMILSIGVAIWLAATGGIKNARSFFKDKATRFGSLIQTEAAGPIGQS